MLAVCGLDYIETQQEITTRVLSNQIKIFQISLLLMKIKPMVNMALLKDHFASGSEQRALISCTSSHRLTWCELKVILTWNASDLMQHSLGEYDWENYNLTDSFVSFAIFLVSLPSKYSFRRNSQLWTCLNHDEFLLNQSNSSLPVSIDCHQLPLQRPDCTDL